MKIEQADVMETAHKVHKKLSKNGGFLTTEAGGRVNTMTVSWWNIGFMWTRPVLTVMVRRSRYTFELIDTAREFTLSIPDPDLPAALSFAGSRSGREGDKLMALGIPARPGQVTQVPVLDIPGWHYECRIMNKCAMEPGGISPELEKYYTDGDYHTFYFGEIAACYRMTEQG